LNSAGCLQCKDVETMKDLCICGLRQKNACLLLPASGYRSYSSGALYARGNYGFYWGSSEDSSSGAWGRGFHSGGAGTGSSSRLYGLSVRCISE
jgi:hypothetical protein